MTDDMQQRMFTIDSKRSTDNRQRLQSTDNRQQIRLRKKLKIGIEFCML
jgi:hypothetical protein